MRKEAERWVNIMLLLLLKLLLKPGENAAFKCFVAFIEECEFVEIVVAFSLPGGLSMALALLFRQLPMLNWFLLR